jgi:cyclic-di-AMP phosphodiesterase PgpH
VKDSVPEQFTLIEAGSFILEPGEKVSSRHIMLIQSMQKVMNGIGYSFSFLSILGTFALGVIITFLTICYLKLYHEDIFKSLRRLTLLTVVAIMTLLIAKGTEYLLLYKGYNLIDVVKYPLVVPFASILLSILLGARIALFSSIFLSVIISLGLVIEYDRFLVLNLIASMCTIIFARGLHKRKEICQVCGKVWICAIPVIMAFHLEESNFWQMSLAIDVGVAFIFLTLTAIVVVGLLPLFEIIFNIVTDMTLMEFMDPNSELLRRLSLEAPGTYQHSLVVGNIAEVAARSIGANDLFCRVAALYHDIGKLFNPHYFTENQLGGFNIHQLLTPLESTHVIIAHVAEGESLARKHSLPQSFIDVIREHHGSTLVYFFYCKQIEQMDGDPSRVNEKLFRYPGPKPHTKEAALIMIADTVEAASRSLDEVTEDAFIEMVDRLIAEKAEEGQFDDCPLTFQELGTVKKSIVKALLVTRHLRIKYPAKAVT